MSAGRRAMRVLLMGPPGGGKGTVGKMMAADFGFRLLSTGDALRREVALRTEAGKRAQAVIEAGGLVPDEDMAQMLKSLLFLSRNESFVLDGYPRSLTQARTLERLSEELRLELDAIFNLDVPVPVLVQRISGRLIHPGSGRTYNEHFSPPKVPMRDDVTGEPLIRRADDEPDAVRKRLDIYQQSTQPILDFFSARFPGKLHELSCETSKEGYAKIKPVLETIQKS